MTHAIEATNLSKVYQLGALSTRTLGEDLNRWWRRTRRKAESEAVSPSELRHRDGEFWALRDVSFEVRQGEVLGVIGHNGAGKSTLLKLLSQVTAPTSGRIRMRGRIASLLEVGTGFHPDLTGRENIFLNGAILGMTRDEIRRNFDEIVAFSDCEAFIDTPVKRYSSGMYVRLAFAVAAHLEPEILIVDEVLAVGDAQFQRKCLGKMRDVSSHGRTVLFVSHSMAAVAALCESALLLRDGRVSAHGSAADVIRLYQQQTAQTVSGRGSVAELPRTGSGKLRFTDVRITAVDRAGRELPTPVTGCDLRIAVTLNCTAAVEGIAAGIQICDANGYRTIDLTSAHLGEFLEFQPSQNAVITFELKDVLLKPGHYQYNLIVGRANLEVMDYVQSAGEFEVHPDVDNVGHWEVFPAVYQCRYSQHVRVIESIEESESHVVSHQF